MAEPLATFTGEVIKGFGRGSKELGIPTANMSEDVIKSLPESVHQGIYFGWAQVNNGPVYKAVMSVGWNPFYNNTTRSAEIHILNKFENDFYGATMRMVVAGYLRPEMNFTSLGLCGHDAAWSEWFRGHGPEALITAIHDDIAQSSAKLDEPALAALRSHAVFVDVAPPQ